MSKTEFGELLAKALEGRVRPPGAGPTTVSATLPVTGYQYRNLAMSEIPIDRCWGVFGICETYMPDGQYSRVGYGLLEYCDGEADAKARLEMMRGYPEIFSKLGILKLFD